MAGYANIEVDIIGESEMAYQVDKGEGAAVWLPKSQCEILEYNEKTGAASIRIPYWLAYKEGFV